MTHPTVFGRWIDGLKIVIIVNCDFGSNDSNDSNGSNDILLEG